MEKIMNHEDRYLLITRGLQEVLDAEYLKELLKTKNPKCYWGTAPTSTIHIGYFIPALKIRDLVNAGCEMTILIADLHAFLDNMKSPFEKIELRSEYYIKMIKAILTLLNVDINKIKFIKGSEYQLEKNVIIDLFKLSVVTRISQAKHAGAEVVKKSNDPILASLLYPLLQSIDEKYLNADIHLGGIDQKKIFGYARDFSNHIDRDKKCCHLMNPIISGLSRKKSTDLNNDVQNKMSASNESSKIDILDTPENIISNIKKAYCLDGDVEDNSVLQLICNFVFPIKGHFVLLKNDNTPITYNKCEDLINDVKKGSLNGGVHPSDLKNSLSVFLIEYLEPIRKEFDSDENRKLLENAYSEKIKN